jgi:hypothetical protein
MSRSNRANALISLLGSARSSSSSSISSSSSSRLTASGSTGASSRGVSSSSSSTARVSYPQHIAAILRSGAEESQEMTPSLPSSRELLMALFANSIRPDDKQADDAFGKGTKLISDLLSENRIDPETAKEMISYFVELYVHHKLECSIRKFLEKPKSEHWTNFLLRLYLEEKW